MCANVGEGRKGSKTMKSKLLKASLFISVLIALVDIVHYQITKAEENKRISKKAEADHCPYKVEVTE